MLDAIPFKSVEGSDFMQINIGAKWVLSLRCIFRSRKKENAFLTDELALVRLSRR